MQQLWFQRDASPVCLGIGASIHHPAVFSPVPAPALGQHLWAQSEENPPVPFPSPTAKVHFQQFCNAGALGKLLSVPSHAAAASEHLKLGHAGPELLRSEELQPKNPPQGFLAIL